jgi:micrococcal nuclease
MSENSLYHYRAIFRSNYDGDTITVDIDLGLNIWVHQLKVRLFGINTPELRSGNVEQKEAGRVARDFVSRRIPKDSEVVVKTHKDKTGKYGRLLGTVYLPTGESINQLLVDRGLAKEVNY